MKIKRAANFSLLCLSLLLIVGHAPAQDLTVLNNYPNPTGDTCSIDGNPNSTPAKKARNRLKNRFEIPDNPQTMSFDEIVALPPAANGAIPAVTNENQTRAVTVTGFVRGVSRGGTRGESCNCKATGTNQVDTHIDLVLSREAADDPNGTGVVVIEVTERSRRLARDGLLASNIGNNWSNAQLKAKILNKWVKITGWLFYDDDHHTGSWRVDPENIRGENNWRATGWEVHPVLGIEVLDEAPDDVPAMIAALNTLIDPARVAAPRRTATRRAAATRRARSSGRSQRRHRPR
jgi:hypothetical protein